MELTIIVALIWAWSFMDYLARINDQPSDVVLNYALEITIQSCLYRWIKVQAEWSLKNNDFAALLFMRVVIASHGKWHEFASKNVDHVS